MTPDGAVRAMVGGRNYAESQFNRAVAAKRQPGSAFKPFVYLTALEHGLTPDSVREDRPIKIKGWQPENYGHEYYGPVTLTKALALSLNTVSVRLTMEFGPAAVIRTAHRLGIASHLEPNASIALGTSEVSLLELIGAYAPFANGGFAVVPHVIERITAANGKLLYARSRRSRSAASSIARYVGDDERDDGADADHRHRARAPRCRAGRRPARPAHRQDFRDAWFIGYTAHLVTGVWLGNDDGTPTKHVTGGGLPVEIWSRFMRGAHQGVPVAGLPGAPRRRLVLRPVRRHAPAPATDGSAPRPPAAIQPRRIAIARPTAAAASTAGCSTICSAAAELVLAGGARAHGARRNPQHQRRACPCSRHAGGKRPGALAEQHADHRAAQRRHALLDEAEQRGGRAGALGKRRHRAGDRLRQHHAEAGEIDRHRQDQRERPRSRPSATAATMPSPPSAQAQAPMPIMPSSPSRVTSRADSVEPVM